MGPSINDKRRPLPFKRFQVRHGPGAMPSFDKSRISDKELSDLMAYLAVLRKHSQRAQEPFEAWEARWPLITYNKARSNGRPNR